MREREGKKLLVVLLDPARTMEELRQGKARYDQEIVDYLAKEKIACFDMNLVHLRELRIAISLIRTI